MKRLARRLLEKSQDSFILGLEIYNRLTINNRIESFSYHFCNSWELLLKSKIIEDSKNDKSVFYPKKRNEPRKSITLSDCLTKVYPNNQNPIRKNIEDIQEIRNAGTHLIIEELEALYSGLFQAGILNYIQELQNWFGLTLNQRCSPGMMTLVCEFDSIDPIFIRKKYGKEPFNFMNSEMDRVGKRAQDIQDVKYIIPIEYKLALVKKIGEADIVLSKGTEGGDKGFIIQVSKDIDKTHPYLTNEIIEEIGKELKRRSLEPGSNFNQYDFQAIVYKDKIKGNPRFHYGISKPNVQRYSPELIDYICNRIKIVPNFLMTARGRYRQSLRSRQSRN